VKNASCLVLALGLVSAGALAQPSPTPGSAYGQASPSSSAAGTQLMTGTVWAYSPGRSITIKVEEGKQFVMTLESGVRVDGSVVVGQLASLMWTTDGAGKTRVMSITAAPGSAMDIEHSAPSIVSPTRRPTAPPPTATPGSSTTPKRTPRPAATPKPSSS